ncbi:MAG: hypothetical protein ABIP90_12520 [Vicinamibacterales bacterium]
MIAPPRKWVIVFAVLLMLAAAGLSAVSRPAPAPPQSDEDRPPIIISSGSVIMSVANGSWVREAAGRYRQELVRGKDVKSFSATTGTGTTVCTVTGPAILVTYGVNALTFGRVLPAGQGGRHASNVKMPADAAVTVKDARTLVVATTDPLVSFSNGGATQGSTCQVVAGRLEIRQVH